MFAFRMKKREREIREKILHEKKDVKRDDSKLAKVIEIDKRHETREKGRKKERKRKNSEKSSTALVTT